ncbi:MAG: hypothetical protein WBP81_33640, partial [Solirubrobacteraceae bacterium]
RPRIDHRPPRNRGMKACANLQAGPAADRGDNAPAPVARTLLLGLTDGSLQTASRTSSDRCNGPRPAFSRRQPGERRRDRCPPSSPAQSIPSSSLAFVASRRVGLEALRLVLV